MTAIPTFLLLFLAETIPADSVGFGEFSLRVGVGMTALVIFTALCCLAWRTVPFLKELIPDYLEKKSQAKSSPVFQELNSTTGSNSKSGKTNQYK